MSQAAIPLRHIIELYSTRGHRVLEIVDRSETVIDLVIQSKSGQKWIARYCHVGVVDTSNVHALLSTKEVDKAVQVALITDGRVTEEARVMADGRTIHIADQAEFDKYLSKARRRANHGLSGWLRQIFHHITSWISPASDAQSAIPRSIKPFDQPQAQQSAFVASPYSSSIPSNLTSHLQPPQIQATHLDEPMAIGYPQARSPDLHAHRSAQSRTGQTNLSSGTSQIQPVAARRNEEPIPTDCCPHGAGRRDNCAICLGRQEYELRYGDWQSD